MNATVPTDFLLRVLQATPEQRAAIERILDGDDVGTAATGGAEPVARFIFRKSGRWWKAVFDRGTPILLEDTLGARYLDYLLHHPNEAISAYDLEILVTPEKAMIRPRDSIQATLDPEAVRACLRELTRLRGEMEVAADNGDDSERRRLQEEIQAIEAALSRQTATADAGGRARDNVRKAIGAVVRQLQKGGQDEPAFAVHIRDWVRTGYDLSYTPTNGITWD